MIQEQPLAAALAAQQRAGRYRRRRTTASPQGATVQVDGATLINFSSNDYLGLANDPRLVEALQRGAAEWGAGSGAAHLLGGHRTPHQQLEEALAAFVGRPRALLFSTGYMANLGAVTALVGRGDGVFADRLNHASLLDAALLSQARLARYAHADADALAQRLAGSRAARKLVVSDGVFSMDGDVAPLPALAAVTQQHGGWLLVDDAHGLGVVGPGGRGTVAQFGLDSEQVPLLVGTLGKAFGSFGAFVAGSEVLIETLIQRARSYIYTTALPPAVAAATCTALQVVGEASWRRTHLQQLTARFRAGAAALSLPLMASETPIQPLLVGDPERCVALGEALRQRGFLVGVVRPPTVPEGSSRLRITLSAAHDTAMIDQLLAALAESWAALPPLADAAPASEAV